jgi:hypothetical protein
MIGTSCIDKKKRFKTMRLMYIVYFSGTFRGGKEHIEEAYHYDLKKIYI